MSANFDEMMIAVRSNLETLLLNLSNLGYRFKNLENSLPGPDQDIDRKIEFIERNIGSVPETLASFYLIVGSVDFTGQHPDWTGCEYPDPIVVLPIDMVIAEAEEFLELDKPEDYWISGTGKFRIPIAPDYYHKEEVSGGMWYGIEVPNTKHDPILLEEWHNTTFFEYLRICFQWGGFPGLERAKEGHTWPLDKLLSGLVAL